MKAVVQVIKRAAVTADGNPSGTAEKGLLVLLGVYESDTVAEAELLASKICKLRVFTDENDKMNLSVLDIMGSVLTVSNFTLCADTSKGNRPSYIAAKSPKEANELYERFVDFIKANGVTVASKGEFGADMQIDTVLDGPVTIILDTDTWKKK